VSVVLNTVIALAWRLTYVLPFMAIGWGLEEFARADASRSTSLRFNVCYTVTFWAFDVILGSVIGLAVASVTLALPGAGFIRLPIRQAPTLVEIVGITFAWISVRDVFYYWFHRWQHASAWLWAQHELHHSDEQMNVSTAWRHHWLEFPLEAVFVVAPITYICTPPAIIVVVAAALTQVMAHFIHMNSRLSLGRWSWLVANPHNHRIHHSFAPEHLDKNFAAVLPLWDVLFGTYCPPRAGEFPATGLASGERVHALWAASLWPFRRWAAMVRPRPRIIGAQSS
jgi:sterol desaturase/sphingolipid hydroxylase (fatty acid hydroxylase superfamily)